MDFGIQKAKASLRQHTQMQIGPAVWMIAKAQVEVHSI